MAAPAQSLPPAPPRGDAEPPADPGPLPGALGAETVRAEEPRVGTPPPLSGVEPPLADLTPMTSEPPPGDLTPLTSEPSLADLTPLTSEPSPTGPGLTGC
ncbi:hypothetical protein AB0942_01960 [Streptomyces nodosus]|uniref:hypothetical protein n=1 Tax=Streptomyces nodosus TaxID=40318 RepID=UPI00345529F4